MTEPERDRVLAQLAGDVVEVHLSGEHIRGAASAAPRSLTHWNIASIRAHTLVREVVGREGAAYATVEDIAVPGNDSSGFADTAPQVDERGRAEVVPGELLFASLRDHDWAADGAGEARGVHGGVPSILSAEGAPDVGSNDTHPGRGNPEGLRHFLAVSEGALRAGVYDTRVVLWGRHRGVGLDRGVGDEGRAIAGTVAAARAREGGLDVAHPASRRAARST